MDTPTSDADVTTVSEGSRTPRQSHVDQHADTPDANSETARPPDSRMSSLDDAEELLDDSIWVGLKFALNFANVSLALNNNEALAAAVPLARFDLIDSKLTFVGHTDGTPREVGSKITLYSRTIAISDVRPLKAGRKNFFPKMLTPLPSAHAHVSAAATPTSSNTGATQTHTDTKNGTDELQLEITACLFPDRDRIHFVMNKARVVVSPEWAMTLGDFLTSRPPSRFVTLYDKHQERIRGRFRNRKVVDTDDGEQTGTATPKQLFFSCSVTDPEFIVVNDVERRDSDAFVLQFSNVLRYDARFACKLRRPRTEKKIIKAETMNMQLMVSAIARAALSLLSICTFCFGVCFIRLFCMFSSF